MGPSSSGNISALIQQCSSNKCTENSLKVNGIEKTSAVQGDPNLVSHQSATGQKHILMNKSKMNLGHLGQRSRSVKSSELAQ